MPAYKDEKRSTWYVKFSTKDPITGKRKQKLKRGFATKRDALAWERENISSGNETSLTFMQLSHYYYAFRNHKERTKNAQLAALEIHFPYFEKPLNKITKPMMVSWYTEFINGKLRPGTVNLVVGIVKAIYKFGADNYGIENSAVSLRRIKSKRREYQTWTAEEFARFISAVDHPLYKALYTFYYWTGCRAQEATSLHKSDFKDGYVHIPGTKTESSDRTLKMPDALRAVLEPILARLESDDDLVFPIAYSSVYRHFLAYTKASGVKPIRIHDLRHSFATNMIGSGANIIAVSKYLGHSTVQQTLTTYSHMFEKADDELVEMIENGIKSVSHTT